MATSFVITVDNANDQFQCTSDTSLLSGMELQSKKAIAVGCRGGGCGFCKIHILSGEFDTKKMSIKFVTKEEQAEGFALSCRVFPRSDMRVVAIEDLSNIKKNIS